MARIQIKADGKSWHYFRILTETLSKDLNIWIENTYPDLNADPTIAIIKEILTGVRKQFGGYSHYKSQASESRLNSIPKFTTSKSVVIGINTINTLNKERQAWTDTAVVDHSFKDTQLKEALLHMMQDHNEMKTIADNFRLKFEELTYAEMQQALTEFATRVMQPQEERVELYSARKHKTMMPRGHRPV